MDHGLTPQEATRPASHAAAHSAAGARPRAAWPRVPASVPLLIVLVLQALLSARLLGADTAFQDEAAYLIAGHLELAHWLHGAAIPTFPSYFSGAPVVYPPLAAIADNIGGLAAARALSLLFTLASTALLWDATRRLFDRRAAFFGAALFAVLGPTLHLGAFATYDAMALFLLALAAWLVIRGQGRRNVTNWLAAAGAVLAVANATAYSSILFDPVVVLLAFLVFLPESGRRVAATRCLTVLAVCAVLLSVGALIGGSEYLHGFELTTWDRVPGGASTSTVLADAARWTGVVVALALASVAVSLLQRDAAVRSWLLTLLAVTGVLGPLEQAHLHTAASLNKHVGLGAWFAAIAAGHLLGRLVAAAPAGSTRTVTGTALVVALAFPTSLGITQAHDFSTDWPSSSDFVAILRPLVSHDSGRLLIEDPAPAEYYLHGESQWMRWSSTRNIVLPSGASSGGPSAAAGVVGSGNAGTYGTKIEENYFSLVALNFADTTALDRQLAADLARNPHYKKILVVPYGPAPGTYVIWRYEPTG
jgi:hypothetical protein